MPDVEDADGGQRFHAIGFAGPALMVLVVYVDGSESEDEEVIRIISARKADAFEESLYVDQFG